MRVSLMGAAGTTICILRTIWHCLHSLKRVFNMHLIGFLLCATKREWKVAPRCGFSPEPQASTCCNWVAIYWSRRGSSKYIVVVFTSDGRWNKETDTRVARAKVVLRELYPSAFTKKSVTAKLKFLKLAFVPILTYGHESCVMMKSAISSTTSGRDGFFAKSSRRGTSRQSAQLWNS